MPYLTPDSIPETDNCRSLLIPASTDWLAIVSGALTELTKPYNWQQEGAVTVAEAVAAMQAMIDLYYEGCTSSCDVGDGLPPFRIGADGHVEQLIDGVWQPPTGDYTIPPTPPRSEPTPEERRCLAAANAANVLDVLYESLTESFSEDRTLEEAVALMIGALATYFFWAAPIAAGLALLALAAMEIVYGLVEFFGADLWDSNFTEALRCMLYECSLDTGDVVTFDYACVQEQLQTTLEHPDLNAEQLRLLIQISYILNVIGGADALNAAGATTEIDDADCSDCDNLWCKLLPFNVSDWDFEPATEFSLGAVYSGGAWRSVPIVIGGNSWDVVAIHREFVAPAVITEVHMSTDVDLGSVTSSCPTAIQFYLGGVFQTGIQIDPSINGINGLVWEGNVTADKVVLLIFASNSAGTGSAAITASTMRGEGDNPFGESDCV